MTDYYVNSAATPVTGLTKADAFTTLAVALAAAVAGDRIFCAHTHAESTSGALTLTSAGTLDNYIHIFSVDFAGSTPPVHADLLSGAVVATGSGGSYNITMVGFATSRGVSYRAGVGSSSSLFINNSTTAFDWIIEDATLDVSTSNAGAGLSYGGSITTAQTINWRNVILKFGSVSQGILFTTNFLKWIGGSVSAAGSAPTTFINTIQRLSRIEIEDVDLSYLGSGKTLVLATCVGSVKFRRCKLGASVTKAATPTNHLGRVEFLNCNSGDVNYDNSIYDYYGTMTTEITIVRTGGASDGTTPISHKIVTTANAAPETPFRSMPIEFWNETLSAITITVQGIWGGGAVPNDDDIWLEADYLGTSGFPLGSRVSDRKASLLSVAAGQAAGSGTWGGSTTKFALSVTITPAEKGLITLNVMAGAASSTFYIDPKPVIT